MPYLPKDQAEKLHRRGFALDGAELNYQVSRAIAQFLANRPQGVNYAAIAEVRGAVTGAFGEFERLVAEPYEDTKRGDADRIDPFLPVLRRLRA